MRIPLRTILSFQLTAASIKEVLMRKPTSASPGDGDKISSMLRLRRRNVHVSPPQRFDSMTHFSLFLFLLALLTLFVKQLDLLLDETQKCLRTAAWCRNRKRMCLCAIHSNDHLSVRVAFLNNDARLERSLRQHSLSLLIVPRHQLLNGRVCGLLPALLETQRQ